MYSLIERTSEKSNYGKAPFHHDLLLLVLDALLKPVPSKFDYHLFLQEDKNTKAVNAKKSFFFHMFIFMAFKIFELNEYINAEFLSAESLVCLFWLKFLSK